MQRDLALTMASLHGPHQTILYLLETFLWRQPLFQTRSTADVRITYWFMTKAEERLNNENDSRRNKEMIKQGRRCAYNVTLRRVRATIFAVEKQ
jgi:hypothetical protein